ncbi:MAG: signal peptidase I [Patescibacteria group bacterium]|nr:signal peptidase I [Patescibacteria group bacterium]
MEIVRKIYTFLLDIVQTLLVAAAVFLVIYMFLFRPFEVNGESMYPNFHDKEYVLTNLIALRLGNPKLGDVVVFKAPPDPEKDYIKRVIGVAGDTVMIKDGNVYLNNQLLDENAFLKSDVKTYAGAFLKEGVPVAIPQGEYFVMGDNRPYSSDSREWGFVKQSELIGESLFVYWPITAAKFVSNPYK